MVPDQSAEVIEKIHMHSCSLLSVQLSIFRLQDCFCIGARLSFLDISLHATAEQKVHASRQFSCDNAQGVKKTKSINLVIFTQLFLWSQLFSCRSAHFDEFTSKADEKYCNFKYHQFWCVKISVASDHRAFGFV